MDKYTIGITGGIGSGKSTVAEILRNNNYPVIDADILAKDVLNDKEILTKLEEEFPQAFNEHILNKKVLSDIVFNSKAKLLKLNSITHPEIAKKILYLIENSNESMLFLDAPLPTKECFLDIVDEIWVVSTQLEIRLQRIMKRSNISQNTALKIIESQMPEEEYLSLSNIIIKNNGTKKELEDKVNFLLQVPRG